MSEQDRRVDDDRIADIQRVCHEVQSTQTRMLEQHHQLAQRVGIVESRVTSNERELEGKLDTVHESIREVSRMGMEHMREEEKDRKELIYQQRKTMQWLAGLVLSAGAGVLMLLLAELPK